MWLGGPYTRFWRRTTRFVSCPTSNLIRTVPSYAGSFVTFRLPLVSRDWWVTSESKNRHGLNPHSKPDEQLRLFSNFSWCAFLRLRVLLLPAGTVSSKLDALRITGNYNACCYNKRYRLCACGGWGPEENTWLRIWRKSGGPLLSTVKELRIALTRGELDWLRNYLTDTAPWRLSAGWHTLW